MVPKKVIVILGLILGLMGCDPFNTNFDEEEEAQFYEADTYTTPGAAGDELLVMNWNAKYGGGRLDFWFDCFGDRVIMERNEVEENLAGLAQKIAEVDPDILMLQEIDIEAKRSAYIDQVQYLLDHTDLNYAVYASQWRADFIPNQGLGRMNSGSAIFSKYPITEATRIALPLLEEQDALTRYFYLRRNILTATVDVPGFGELEMLNLHADAYGGDGTKKKHIDRLKEELDRLDEGGRFFVGGGDFNTLPPGSVEQCDFEDAVCEDEDFMADDYREEANWMTEYYQDYQAAIPLVDYQADNAPFLTHSVSEDVFWNRKLDYLFTNGEFVEGSGRTLQQGTMELSDHAPVTVRVRLEAP